MAFSLACSKVVLLVARTDFYAVVWTVVETDF